MKHIKKINETFRDDKSNMDLSQMMKHKPTYKDGVYNYLHDIICNEEGISEKSFSKIDEVSERLENFYNEYKIELDDIIKTFEDNNMRKEYCAEKIYNDFKVDKK